MKIISCGRVNETSCLDFISFDLSLLWQRNTRKKWQMAPLKYELICAYSNMNLNMLDKGMAQTSNWNFEAKYIYLGNNMNNLCNCKNKFNIMQVFTRKYVHIIPFIINRTAIKFWPKAYFCFSFLCGVQYQWLPILYCSVHSVGRYPYGYCSLIYKKHFLQHKKCSVMINSVCSLLRDFSFFFITLLDLSFLD